MPTPSPKRKESGKKKEIESLDSDFGALIEQMKLKNDALKKIYEYFEKKKSQESK